VHFVEPDTGAIHSKVLKRAQLKPFFANRARCRVVMDACGSAHHWARQLAALGHDVQLIAAQFVRPLCSGPSGLVSAKRGHVSNRELPIVIRMRAMALIRERYADFGPTLACEKLCECHGFKLAKETVRRWMRDAGLWIPRKQRPPKIHQPRNRRACVGELVQIDGSDHRWFEERAPACTLLVASVEDGGFEDFVAVLGAGSTSAHNKS